jgi:hypothetical protein
MRRVVGLGRFELPTSRLSGVRSNHLSYRPDPRASNAPPEGKGPGCTRHQAIPVTRADLERETETAAIRQV